MERCFLIPMSDPPYSRLNPQCPKYINELEISWSGVPLFIKKYYIVKAVSTVEKLDALQAMVGVIDFPNNDNDTLDSLPIDRKTKNEEILKVVSIKTKNKDKVKDFINNCANSELDHKWDKDQIVVI